MSAACLSDDVTARIDPTVVEGPARAAAPEDDDTDAHGADAGDGGDDDIGHGVVFESLVVAEMSGEIQQRMELPAPAKMTLARGLGGLRPRDLVVTLYALAGDRDHAVAEAARRTLDDLPPNVIATLARDPLPQKLLHYWATSHLGDELYRDVLNAVAVNPAAPDRTMEYLCRHGDDALGAVLADNQTRLVKTPRMVFALADNPGVSVATVSRALEFARRENALTAVDEREVLNRTVLARVPPPPEAEEAPADVATAPVSLDHPSILGADEAGNPIFHPDLVQEDDEAPADDSPEALAAAHLAAGRRVDVGKAGFDAKLYEKEVEKKARLVKAVRTMNVGQRLKLALFGNSEARGILIRDPVKQVAVSVIQNAKITRQEIEKLLANKSTAVELINEIQRQRGLMKHYSIRYLLTIHPRTGFTTSMNLMAQLQTDDIKKIAKSRQIPLVIRNLARAKLEADQRKKTKK